MVRRVYGGGDMRRFVLCLLLGIALPACGNQGEACAAPTAEAIDPSSSQHILPGAPAPKYSTNPPTSGAHRPGPLPGEVLTSPLDKPAQVAALEGGQVLIQYGKITPEDRRKLATFAHRHDHVTVAPGRDLPAKVVATAWLFMQQCKRVDVGTLQEFVTAHAGAREAD
jgi:hypothetical protein